MLGQRSVPGLIDRDGFESLAATVAPAVIDAAIGQVNPDDIGIMVYTSGTTANPKGCQLTSRGVVWVAREGGVRFTVRDGDVFWDPLPLFHMSAILPINFTLDVGGTFVSMTHFDPATALAQMREFPPTLIYPCFPPITMPLINHPDWERTDLSQVRVWLNVAPVETLRIMQRALPKRAADRQLRHHRGRRHRQLQRCPRDGRTARAHGRATGAEHRGQDRRPRDRRRAAPRREGRDPRTRPRGHEGLLQGP